MKKLLYFVVSVLSLSVIFGAGWASGVGVTSRISDSPAALIEEITDDCPECPDGEDSPNDKCPERPDNNGIEHRKYGFRMRIPFPPFDPDKIVRNPKAAN